MKIITCKLGLLVLAVIWLIGCSDSRTSTTEQPEARIVIVAKDQAFHLDGQPDLRNPPITLKRGQVTELVLRNDDPGRVLHCFSISGLDVKIATIDAGQTVSVTVRPTERGTLTYACLMHPPMAGKLIVQ